MGSHKSPPSAETQSWESLGQACQPHPLSLWVRAGLQPQMPDSDLGSNRGHQRLCGTMSTEWPERWGEGSRLSIWSQEQQRGKSLYIHSELFLPIYLKIKSGEIHALK